MHVQAVTVVDAVAAEWGSVAYESHIELHTGRTHQVSPLHTLYISGQATGEDNVFSGAATCVSWCANCCVGSNKTSKHA